MILGTGIDIIEIQRVATAVKKPRFLERVFTKREQEYCESRQAQKAGSYAVRFAAKEAVMKALGTGLSGGCWLDIEIVSVANTKPRVCLAGFYAAIAREAGVTDIQLSLSHSRDFAVAQAITWGGMRDESCHSN